MSIGPQVTFSLRRARFALAGDVTDRVYCYFQPDFAAVPADGSVNFLQVRDLYADLPLDAAKTSRVRVGQSKIPFGFEEPQSSQNRLALERTDAITSATKGIPRIDAGDPVGLVDQRVAAHLVVYPQPFGFQAEYTAGQGPRLDDAHAAVVSAPLRGGYLQTMYRWAGPWGFVTPFVRWSVYDGGKKVERDAPYMQVDDLEGGVEWQIDKALELTAQVERHDRTNPLVWPYVRQQTTLLRTQVQWNF